MSPKTWFVLILLAAATTPASAQWPSYPPPNAGWPGSWPSGRGGVLQGSASVIQSSGDLMIQQQQARQQYQIGEQEKLRTRKQAFDLAAYEKANTPAFTEEQDKVQAMQLRRMMTQANDAEIARGDTLNAMMPMIRSFGQAGVQAPLSPLDSATVSALNVSAPGAASTGMLQGGGAVRWPVMLRGPQQQKIDKLLGPAIELAIKDELTPKVVKQLQGEVNKFQEDWRKEFHKEKIDGGTFLNGKKFLDSLATSVQSLQNPDAAKMLGGSQRAVGSSVPDLVDNMTRQGLRFAPATPGREAPYFAMHNAFVSFAQAGMASDGFRTASAPPSTGMPIPKMP